MNPIYSSPMLQVNSAILHDVGLTPPVTILKSAPPPWSHPLNPKQICALFWIHIGLIWIRIQHKTLMWIRILDPDHVKIRVATKVGFHNFAKYEISRNTLLISRNSAKFREIYRYEFREISARNLISRNFAKFIGTNFAKFRKKFNFAKFIGTNFAKFRQGI